MEVYVVEDLDNLTDKIEKILTHNKLMEGLHEKILWIKDKAQEKFLEEKRYYNAASLAIWRMILRPRFLQCNQ